MRGSGRILRDRVPLLGSLLSRLRLLLRDSRRPRRLLVDLDLLRRPARRLALKKGGFCKEIKMWGAQSFTCFVLDWTGGCECV